MEKFIYVYNKEDSEYLAHRGFNLIAVDGRNNIYVFENKPDVKFGLLDISYILSDTLFL